MATWKPETDLNDRSNMARVSHLAVPSARPQLPVVGSDVRGTNELIVDGQTGFLVPVNNITGYAERLQQLLSDESLRRDIGERAVARARATFSMERQVDEHLNLYAYLAASEGARLGPRRNDDLMQLDCQ